MLVVIRSVGRPVFYGYDLPLRTQQARGNQECTTRRVRGRPTHFYVRPPPSEYKPCATATGPRRELPQAPTARHTRHTAARLLRCSPFSVARLRPKRAGWNSDLMERCSRSLFTRLSPLGETETHQISSPLFLHCERHVKGV